MIIKFKDLESLQKEKTVCTAGTFDLFHRGHVDFLSSLKEKFPKYKVVVGILSDRRVRIKKGNDRPIIKQDDRIKIIDAIKFVDYSFMVPLLESGERSAMFMSLEKIEPDIVALPGHEEFKDIELEGELNAANIRLALIDAEEKDESTSLIIQRIKKSN